MLYLHAGRQDMDPENVGKETVLKVTDWLRGIWEMKRHAGGPAVQQWLDSIPMVSTRSEVVVAGSECRDEEIPRASSTEPEDIPFARKNSKLPSMTISAPINVPNSPAMSAPPMLPSSLPHHKLARDASFQSDSSSVESLLELRKADPTAILLDLGFGGCTARPQEDGPLSRIPKRFLQPSSLPGIAIDEFLKQQQETSESFDSISLGYRGLTGSPHVAPSEIVQKIMERLRENESHEADTSLYNYEQYNPICQNGMLSVLSPDNRQFLEQPRSKSPDMRNKRMIIGQKSFAFGCDGNLIELPSDATGPGCDADEANRDNSDNEKFVESKQSSPEEGVITFERRDVPKSDRKLAKQLSFEFAETEPKVDRETPNDVDPSETNADERRPESEDDESTRSSAVAKCRKHEFPDVRSSSDGSFRVESLANKPAFNEGRRFSDGAVRAIKNLSAECRMLMQKRRSFKRQPRVYDTATRCRDPSPVGVSGVSNATITESHIDESGGVSNNSARELSAPISIVTPIEDEKAAGSLSDEETSRAPSASKSSSRSLAEIERFEAAEEDAPSDHSSAEDKICCFKGKTTVCKNCKQSKNCPDCGCHVDKQRYLKKMDRIMQKNKKLENMLARSRREMAEIRDMLSSVLSVRMEPGF